MPRPGCWYRGRLSPSAKVVDQSLDVLLGLDAKSPRTSRPVPLQGLEPLCLPPDPVHTQHLAEQLALVPALLGCDLLEVLRGLRWDRHGEHASRSSNDHVGQSI